MLLELFVKMSMLVVGKYRLPVPGFDFLPTFPKVGKQGIFFWQPETRPILTAQ